jgi:hypothetical protein
MIRLRCCVLLITLAAASCGEAAITQPGAMPLPPPVITNPPCGGVSRWPTDPVTLSWTVTSGASTYTIEVDCMNCGNRLDPWVSQSGTPWRVARAIPDPTYRFDVAATVKREGGRAMRWRVWAVDPDGVEGTKTDWCVTVFNDSGLPTPGKQTP